VIKYILSALFAGIAVGYVNNNYGNVFANVWISDYVFTASLILLLFVMGLAFGIDKESITKLRQTGPRILIIPLSTASGSICAGALGGLILGINPIASATVTAGYGWYTLAGPMVWQIFGAEWGALGFATNFLREILTIITTPLMRRVDKYAPIASGGATSMDTTLPVIVRYSGSDVLVASFASGFILTAVAPFTIIAIASLR
jgi:uncharacterized membrane protein YbjE (DUF340 family)